MQLFQSARQALEGGRPAEAIEKLDAVRRTWNDHPDIWLQLQTAYGQLGRHEDVIHVSEMALETDPGHFDFRLNLVRALMHQGVMGQALAQFEKAVKAGPGDPEAGNDFGRILYSLERHEEALAQFHKVAEAYPEFAPAQASLGIYYAEQGARHIAMGRFNQALRSDPESIDANFGAAKILNDMGKSETAALHFRKVLEHAPKHVGAYIGLAHAMRMAGRFDEAQAALKTGIKAVPDATALVEHYAYLLTYVDRHEDAHEILSRLTREKRIGSVGLYTYAAICQRFGDCDTVLAAIDETIRAPKAVNRQALYYSAGKLLDKLGRYDEAFDHITSANCCIDLNYDARAEVEYTDAMIRDFSAFKQMAMPRATTGSSRPIFIIGLPRSGTSLTEQILAAHPDVYGAGELGVIDNIAFEIKRSPGQDGCYADRLAKLTVEDMNAYAQRYLNSINELDSGARFVTDKLPHNFKHVGLISLLFPEARIIHCRRNPLDNALSIYFEDLLSIHAYASRLEDVGHMYNTYRRLMKHWESISTIPVFAVDYEEMVTSQEPLTRRLLEFCGLDWDERVMNFHESDRNIATASFEQVRQPLYKTSKERWRNYEKHLGALREILESGAEI